MKTCMIYYHGYTFNANFIREAESLVENGDQVDVICLSRGKKEKKFERLNKVNVYRIMERNLDEKMPLHYLVKMVKFFVLCTFLVTKLHSQKKYDLIHVTSPPDFMVFTSIIPKLLGAKVLLDIHDIVPEFFARKFNRKDGHWLVRTLMIIEKISAKFADHVITVTDIWRTTLISRSVAESKCSVVLNTPDTKVFKGAGDMAQQKRKSGEFTLLYPGNLDFGVETLIRSMPLIAEKIPSVKLQIHGGGASLTRLMKLSEAIGVSNHVNFRGPVIPEELAKIMENADVGIDPMTNGAFFGEVLSVKSLEFLQMGLPVVVSRRAATEYYFNDSMVMFFEPENERDLARAVIELYENPEKRYRLIRNGRKFVDVHNWNNYKKIYYDIITSLCGGSQVAAEPKSP